MKVFVDSSHKKGLGPILKGLSDALPLLEGHELCIVGDQQKISAHIRAHRLHLHGRYLGFDSRTEAATEEMIRLLATTKDCGGASFGDTKVIGENFIKNRKLLFPGNRLSFSFASLFPGRKGPLVAMDLGGRLGIKPEIYIRNAYWGSCMAEAVLNISRPKVGIVSISPDPHKGSPEKIAANAWLIANSGLNYMGFIAANQALSGEVDAIVFNAEEGNLVIKFCEALMKEFGRRLRSDLNFVQKMVAGPAIKKIMEELNPDYYGGADVAGINVPFVKGHSDCTGKAVTASMGRLLTAHAKDLPGLIASIPLPDRKTIPR